MRIKALRIGLAFGALALVNAASASAATLYVDDSGSNGGPNDCLTPSNPCATIQYAIDIAGTDTIHIGGGFYTEGVDLNGSETLMEDSAFSGAAAGPAVLTSPTGVHAVEFFTPGTVQGLTIRSDFMSVRFATGGNLTGNTFDTSAAPSGPYSTEVLIDALPGNSPTISGNTFVDSTPIEAHMAIVSNASPSSPMIDAGNTAVPPIGTLDIDGDLRGLSSTPACTPSAGRRDIGADEFVPAPPAGCTPSVTPPTTTPPKKCKKGRKLKKGKCVKKKRKKKRKK